MTDVSGFNKNSSVVDPNEKYHAQFDETQAQVDGKVSGLAETLESDDHLDVIGWITDFGAYAQFSLRNEDVAVRLAADDDTVDPMDVRKYEFHLPNVVEQLEQAGYSESPDENDPDFRVLNLIGNAISKMKDGDPPLGHESNLLHDLFKARDAEREAAVETAEHG